MNRKKTSVTFAKKFSVIALLSSALWSSAALAQAGGVTAEVITLGQSTALSGPLGDLGQEVLKGAKVYFDALNARGGVNGRTIKLVSKDDAYDVKKTLENVNATHRCAQEQLPGGYPSERYAPCTNRPS